MVITRSEAERMSAEELHRIEQERLRGQTRLSPASPSMPAEEEGPAASPSTGPGGAPVAAAAVTNTRERAVSPQPSNHSHRSRRTTNSTLQVRLAELEAAEKLAAIKCKELEIEADLIKKRLALQIAEAEAEGSLRDEPNTNPEDQRQRVNEWLRVATSRGERHEPSHPIEQRTRSDRHDRSSTPGRTRSYGPQIAEVLDRMSRPQRRYNCDLPKFSGSPTEWLRFKAAMKESTILFKIPPVENVLRLQTALTGDALEAVSAHLMTDTTPDRIMETLEQSFGSPETIVDKITEDIKRIPKLGLAARDLNKLAVKVQNAVSALQSMDRRGCLYDMQLTREVMSKLTPTLRNKWYEYAHAHEESKEPDIVMLSQFLMREAKIALRYAYEPQPTCSAATRNEVKTNVGAIAKRKLAVYNTEQENDHEQLDRCPKCSNPHGLPQCPEYRALNIDRRWDFVKENGLCFKCVTKKHRRIHCREKVCGVNKCRRPHHSTLHQDEKSAPASIEPAARSAELEKPTHDGVVLSVAASKATGPREVLLKVCPVVVSGPKGEVRSYALLDEGATITLIDQELATSIGADGPKQPLKMSGVNMTQREQDSKLVTIRLKGESETALYTVKARTVRNLRLREQTAPQSLLKHRHLRDLGYEVCYDRARPLILVGADYWELIVSRELRVGAPNEPAASRTQLGWVVHGTTPRSIIYQSKSVLHVYAPDQRIRESETHDQRLYQLVENHFKIESLGISLKPRVSEADERAIKSFTKTVKKIDGAYEVGLPWRRDDVTMPASYGAALNRLKGIERKMDASPVFAKEYSAQIENLLAKGYAELCDGTERQSAISWYLPHFTVENPNKPGKRRLVFDAAHRSNNVCLNDRLLEGPDLLLSLPGVVFRFREKPIAVTADIQEMFLRIKLRTEDQPAQQFLWRGTDRTSPPRIYKMTSMIFGAASSPFLAHSVRDYNARAHGQTHPRALVAITKSHYMDDSVDSYDNEDEARRTIQELRDVHAIAGFTLRGWSSNKTEILNDVPSELRANAPTRLGGAASNKILGLFWNADKDELGFNTGMHRVPEEVRAQARAPTKREALSAVMSLYDPIGLVTNYTIRGRILLQALWREQLTWDEQIPDEHAERFAAWLHQLQNVERLRLRRNYALEACDNIELHVMCDASEEAYATVAYWRAIRPDRTIVVAQVAGKAKVAPRRTQSIPRLELQAAVIGTRLAAAILEEHRLKVTRTIYWTDSSTVIQWIRNDRRRYTPFVAHRLGEIAESTDKAQWRWVPTLENAADDATRFTSADITSEDRWFRGPNFLHQPEDQWPIERFHTEDSKEVLHVTETDEPSYDWLPEPERYSRYEVLVRTVGRVLAFIDICRRRSTRFDLEHIERAEKLLLQRAQQESFNNELRQLRAGRPIFKSSRLYKLDPMVEDGVLRLRGRINASDASVETKRPVILDGRHRITKLIVQQAHCAAGHGNRERVTNDLRQRYWVIHLRPTVRTIESKCVFCRVRKARPNAPTIGDLPRARLQPFHRAFSFCACDYFGPMWVKVGRRREKRWGALYTCLTTRGVHLEIVASLSSDSAIMALRRMAARRGWPCEMWSDNATAFRGADHELKLAYKEWAPLLREEGLRHRMRWLYIAPGAPRQGGAWERLVRSVKTALAVTLHEKAPTEEVLQTVLAEAEYAINARPLTHVSVDARDPEALTPNHFLMGSSGGLPTNGPCSEVDRRTWRASQALADSFWRRWLREYLPTLTPRGEAANKNKNIEIGDVVVVVDRTLPRNVWPMGIVEKTYPGPDGGVRIVDIKTKMGVFRRPSYKLAVLERVPEEGFASCAEGRMLRTPSPSQIKGDRGSRRGARRGCGRAGLHRPRAAT